METAKEFDVPESIDDRQAPRPGAGEIVVAIQAAGINAMDAGVVAGDRR